jgi:hypothetical protein
VKNFFNLASPLSVGKGSTYCKLGGIKISHKTEVLNKEWKKISMLYAIGTDASIILDFLQFLQILLRLTHADSLGDVHIK